VVTSELSRYLFLVGALPFLFLGAAHLLATPLSRSDRKGLTPADPALADAMAKSAVLLTRRTDMWLAWVGFNLSHSLGAIAFALFVLVVGRSSTSFAGQASLCVPLATVVAASYVAIGVKYWFGTPIAGCTLALACFAASWAAL
jgi:hypothetical protein